jgi:hypothetical protein
MILRFIFMIRVYIVFFMPCQNGFLTTLYAAWLGNRFELTLGESLKVTHPILIRFTSLFLKV